MTRTTVLYGRVVAWEGDIIDGCISGRKGDGCGWQTMGPEGGGKERSGWLYLGSWCRSGLLSLGIWSLRSGRTVSLGRVQGLGIRFEGTEHGGTESAEGLPGWRTSWLWFEEVAGQMGVHSRGTKCRKEGPAAEGRER